MLKAKAAFITSALILSNRYSWTKTESQLQINSVYYIPLCEKGGKLSSGSMQVILHQMRSQLVQVQFFLQPSTSLVYERCGRVSLPPMEAESTQSTKHQQGRSPPRRRIEPLNVDLGNQVFYRLRYVRYDYVVLNRNFNFIRTSILTALVLPQVTSRQLILQQAHNQTLRRSFAICKIMILYSTLTPLPGFFSPFPHGTSSLWVISVLFSLTSRRSWIQKGYKPTPCYLGELEVSSSAFESRTFTLYSSGFQLITLAATSLKRLLFPQPPRKSLDLSNFAHRYQWNRFCFILLQVLRCFNSLGYLFLLSLDVLHGSI